MENPIGSYQEACEDFVDSYQEHLDYEAGAEDMELRFLREEAARDYQQECAFDAMDMLDEMDAARQDDGEIPAPVAVIPAPMDFGDDDIPF